MIHSGKRRGFRTIDVEGHRFRWKFFLCPDNSYMTLQGMVSSGQPIDVTLLGWRDPWLAIGSFQLIEEKLAQHTREQNEPQTVTPRFAREAILHCLAKGWRPNERGPRLYCVYSNGTFSALSPNRDALMLSMTIEE